MSNTDLFSDIVLTGRGVISPFGLGWEPFEKALQSRQSAVKPLTRFQRENWCRAQLAATVPEFSLEKLTSNPKESSRAVPLLRLAWAAMHFALEDARIVMEYPLTERVGIFVGLGRFVFDRVEYIFDKILTGKVHEVLPIRVEGIHPHGTAVHLAICIKS